LPKPIVLELTDIYEGGYLCSRKKPFIDDVIEENIKYILKKNKIPFDDIVIPPGGALYEIDIENGTYQLEFEVLGKTDYYGTAYGHGIADLSKYQKTKDECDIYFEIYDMTIELNKKE